jgi:copper chaperone CopZ
MTRTSDTSDTHAAESRDAGLSGVAQTSVSELTFGVTGMTCASCAVLIEKALAREPGVVSASVNLALERVTVEYDPALTDAVTVERAIEGVGYGACPIGDTPDASGAPGASGEVTLGLLGMTCWADPRSWYQAEC